MPVIVKTGGQTYLVGGSDYEPLHEDIAFTEGSAFSRAVMTSDLVSFIIGNGQYDIRETLDIPRGSLDGATIGSYFTAVLAGNNLTLTPTRDGYLHEIAVL